MRLLDDNFKFIDLFAGIGGFHYAMKRISASSKCLYASEINENAKKIYELNFKQKCDGDIIEFDPHTIEKFDVLCAGFPCQPFSKAGYQNGFSDSRGNLFFEIARIIDSKIKENQKPKLIVLENVRNLESHDNGDTWKTIYNTLDELGYNTVKKPIIASPNDFGVPQLRDRAIIIAIDKDIFSGDMVLPIDRLNSTVTIFSILEDNSAQIMNEYGINEYEDYVLKTWDEFYKIIDIKIIGFPVWSDEFGKTYDISHYPKWKQNFIIKNRELYIRNKKAIDKWLVDFKVHSLKKTHRKFEWQAGNSINSIFEGIIQFRPSGVRVKKPDYAPTLVAMAHVPIIGKYKRYITPIEASKLQSLPDNFQFDSVGKDIYRLLGNAVNVEVIYQVVRNFIQSVETSINKKYGG